MKKNVEQEIKKIKYLFEYKMGLSSDEQSSLMNEYDIDDDNIKSTEFMKELTSDGGDEIIREIGITAKDEEGIQEEGEELFCQLSDTDSFVEKKFGSMVKDKFKEKGQEVLDTLKEYINKFIDFLITLKNPSDIKKLFKKLKSKKLEIEKTQSEDEGVLKEFFGTSMALVTIFGSFTMPALVLTIASVVLVTFIGLWLINALLCAININITSIKGCRVRSFEWGQCK